MSSYTLAGILAQPIPDHLMLDIALHLQANDNRCANQQTSQLNNFLDRPPHQPRNAFVVIPGRSHGAPRWLPRGSKAQDISERLSTTAGLYRFEFAVSSDCGGRAAGGASARVTRR